MGANIVEVYYLVDEFSRIFDPVMQGHLLPKDSGKRSRKRKFTMSDSEVITILILFHLKQFRNLKAFYTRYIQVHCRDHFPHTVSYSHKTFKGIADRGKSTAGRFFGFRLHTVINDRGEIFDFIITQANTDDREPLKNRRFQDKLFGRIFAGRGYVSRDLFEKLFVDGIHLITGLKKNMKNALMPIRDKLCLRKRALMETVNDELKNICQIEHTRHCSFVNFIANMISALLAYNLLPKKPSLNLDIVDLSAVQKSA